MIRGLLIGLSALLIACQADAQQDRRDIRIQSYAGRMLLHVIKAEYDNQLTAVADITFKGNSREKLSTLSLWINPGLDVMQVVDGKGQSLSFSTTMADIDPDAGLSAKRIDVSLLKPVSRTKSGTIKIQYKGKPQPIFSTQSGRPISDGEKLGYDRFSLGYDGLAFPVPAPYLQNVNDLDNGGGQAYAQVIRLTLPTTHSIKPGDYIVKGPTANGPKYDYSVQSTTLSNRINIVVNSLR